MQLLLGDLPAADRARQANALAASVASLTNPFAGLFLATRNEQPLAACWAQVQPGRTGVLWRPHLSPAYPETATVELITRANDYFAQQGVTMAQALLSARDDQAAGTLSAAGYRHLTDLEYLVCLLRPKPFAEHRRQMEYEVYSDRNHARFCGVLERTYQHSLDCPELDGLRGIEDVLVGYRNTGVFHPSRWMILRQEDRDVGCLLLADHPDQDQWELVYLGIVPEARGHGLGFEAVCFATRLAYGARRYQMVLAVDSRNAPARGVYERAGFVEWDRRQVFLRTFSARA
ncbi:MAG: GNAT family N-acetyltransferase [Pirellulales bacterium]